MKTWAIIWSTVILTAIIGMVTGARWMWAVVFIGAILLCGALAELTENKNKETEKQWKEKMTRERTRIR